jgi:hypothetical protein
MKVHVRPMRYQGAFMFADELKTAPARSGLLEVVEERDNELGRSTVRARLIDAASRNFILPELKAASLLWLKDGKMRLSGVESIDSRDYAQTWSVEVQ